MSAGILHCVWLAGPKSALVRRAQASWRTFLPRFEVREWKAAALSGESFCGWTIPPYVHAALAAKKWAFASDWMRFAALHADGGVYLDCDVELKRAPTAEDWPEGEWVASETLIDGSVRVNPGSGMALAKGSAVAAAMLDYYATAAFDETQTVGEILVRVLAEKGLAIARLPPEVMSPLGVDGRPRLSARTVAIHHYAMSWAGPRRRLAKWLSWHGMRFLVDFYLRHRR